MDPVETLPMLPNYIVLGVDEASLEIDTTGAHAEVERLYGILSGPLREDVRALAAASDDNPADYGHQYQVSLRRLAKMDLERLQTHLAIARTH